MYYCVYSYVYLYTTNSSIQNTVYTYVSFLVEYKIYKISALGSIYRIHNKTHFLPVYTNTITIIIIQSKRFYKTRIGKKRANERVRERERAAQIRTIESVEDKKNFLSLCRRSSENRNRRVWWCFAMHILKYIKLKKMRWHGIAYKSYRAK